MGTSRRGRFALHGIFLLEVLVYLTAIAGAFQVLASGTAVTAGGNSQANEAIVAPIEGTGAR